VGWAGLADVFARQKFRKPGELLVHLDGQTAAQMTLGIDDGWRRFDVATTPGTHRLTFEASAIGPNTHVCFAAEARE
jgi:hypothetical protein